MNDFVAALLKLFEQSGQGLRSTGLHVVHENDAFAQARQSVENARQHILRRVVAPVFGIHIDAPQHQFLRAQIRVDGRTGREIWRAKEWRDAGLAIERGRRRRDAVGNFGLGIFGLSLAKSAWVWVWVPMVWPSSASRRTSAGVCAA